MAGRLQREQIYACLKLIPGPGRSPGEGIGYPFQYSWASLVVQIDGKESTTCDVGDPVSIPALGRSPEGEYGNPF